MKRIARTHAARQPYRRCLLWHGELRVIQRITSLGLGVLLQFQRMQFRQLQRQIEQRRHWPLLEFEFQFAQLFSA